MDLRRSSYTDIVAVLGRILGAIRLQRKRIRKNRENGTGGRSAMSIMSSHRRSLTACVMAACFVGFCSAFVPTSLPVRSGLAPAALSSAAVGGRMRVPIAPARCQLRRGALQLRAGADDWARTERVTFEGDTLAYTEEVEGVEVGVAQAKVPLSAEQPYYEVTVEDGGTQSWIGVGIATNDYPLDKQPGWEQSSVGYHADDGMYYRSPVPDQMSKRCAPDTRQQWPCPHSMLQAR
eukprot:482532-Rhodomonas_salina.2